MTIGIYVHTPFCLSKCPYCDFNSIVLDSNLVADYVQSLIKEILTFSKDQNQSLIAETIYFGGGTPSILKITQLGSILKAISNSFNVKPGAEISLEANPGTLTEEKAKNLKKLGFNRVSLGVQSFEDEALKILGRAHNSKKAIKSYQLLRKYFDNLSLDLIFGIPGQNLKTWRENLNAALKLNPEHLSVYSLTIEEGTLYHHLWKQKKLSLPDEEEVRRMYLLSINLLQNQEYRQYELSNFARKGFECQHNLRYWQGKEYLGFGAGAHSYYKGARWGNVKNVRKYIEGCKKGFSVIDFREKLTSSQKITEFILLGLRMAKGINSRRLKEDMSFDIEEEKKEEIAKLIEGRFLKKGRDNLRLTKKGILVADLIIQKLIP